MRFRTVFLAVLIFWQFQEFNALAVLESKSENQKSSSTLVPSDNPVEDTSHASPQPSQNQGKIRFNFVPKKKEEKKEGEKKAEDYDPYLFGYSKRKHPYFTKPEGSSPFVQTVGSPPSPYTRPRVANVLDPGKQKGSGGAAQVSGRARTPGRIIRPASTESGGSGSASG